MLPFENFNKTDPTSERIADLEGLHADFERKFQDLLEMDYPLWFFDLENYEQEDERSELVETRLDLEEDVKRRVRISKEGMYAFILIKDSHPTIFQQAEASIFFHTLWIMVESAFSAALVVFSE